MCVYLYRLLIIDNFDSIPPSNQQFLKKIMEQFLSTLKYIFVCNEPKLCMIQYIYTKSTNVKTKVTNELDALQILLTICYQNQIGYNLSGIQMIFKVIVYNIYLYEISLYI